MVAKQQQIIIITDSYNYKDKVLLKIILFGKNL